MLYQLQRTCDVGLHKGQGLDRKLDSDSWFRVTWDSLHYLSLWRFWSFQSYSVIFFNGWKSQVYVTTNGRGLRQHSGSSFRVPRDLLHYFSLWRFWSFQSCFLVLYKKWWPTVSRPVHLPGLQSSEFCLSLASLQTNAVASHGRSVTVTAAEMSADAHALPPDAEA
jgi:hypothetical protein